MEPDNRLGARALERQWEEALRHAPHEPEADQRFCREPPPAFTPRNRAALRRFAHDLPGVGAAPETTAPARQELVRLWREQVTGEVHGDQEQGDVTRHWAGGGESRQRVMRPVARYAQWSTYPRLLARIETLRHDGMRVAQMAEQLKRAGCYPPTRRDQFNGGMSARVRSRRGRHGPRPRAMGAAGVLEPHEYWRSD